MMSQDITVLLWMIYGAGVVTPFLIAFIGVLFYNFVELSRVPKSDINCLRWVFVPTWYVVTRIRKYVFRKPIYDDED